jgi:hypothetical protein
VLISNGVNCFVEILDAITGEEKQWIKELYESMEFNRYRKHYIEIHQKLENTHRVEMRRPLIREAYGLLMELKKYPLENVTC